jgi:hypothetical protein
LTTFADRVNQFNKELTFDGVLPHGIRVMNPFQENPEIISITELFYNTYFKDTRRRKLILGINPGRLGAGQTGIPFTDSKRLEEFCGIRIESVSSHEPSSVFVYDMIEKYGGAKKFYSDFYINAICPLGFVQRNEKQNWVNRNYYDYDELFAAMRSFITRSLKKQISFGVETEVCYVLGKRNARYLRQINAEEKLFGTIVALDHPRYIEQYKSKQKVKYIDEYLNVLSPQALGR